MNKMKDGLYNIDYISKLCGISISRLRYYAEHGIILPDYVDEETGYRYYKIETILMISSLRYFQCCGFTLNEIRPLLQRLGPDHLENVFDGKISELEKLMQEIQMQQDSLRAWKDLLLEGKHIRTAGVSEVTHRYAPKTLMYTSTPQIREDIGYDELFANPDLYNRLKTHENSTIGPQYLHFTNYETRDLRSARFLMRPHPSETPVTDTEFVGGCCLLSAFHIGAYEEIGSTYDRILSHAKRCGIPLRGDSIERFVIDRWSTISDMELVTEIMLPTAEPASDRLNLEEDLPRTAGQNDPGFNKYNTL